MNEAEKIIDGLDKVFAIATTGFDDFKKNAKEVASGYESKAASSGDWSKAASSGNGSTAASSGNGSTAASSGDWSKSSCKGECSACSAVGYRAAVKGDIGSLIMASEYKKDGSHFIPVGGKADIIDGKILKPDCWYIVENGEWVEVDFTDGIFSYVISSKNGVKKVKDEKGKVMYVVTDGENYAHGDTIQDARESLVYKISSRDTSEYEG